LLISTKGECGVFMSSATRKYKTGDGDKSVSEVSRTPFAKSHEADTGATNEILVLFQTLNIL
jgi:hypothetical protein